jgi:predicted GIY-YIG superfamily endonuclease
MNATTKQNDEQNGIFLYVLELQNQKFYVGITNNPEQRFEAHRSGQSVTFVKKNLPIINIEKRLLKTTDRFEAERFETKKTINLIRKYGIANVCGGEIVGDYHDRILRFKLLMNRFSK